VVNQLKTKDRSEPKMGVKYTRIRFYISNIEILMAYKNNGLIHQTD